jgi:hypothetical protein
MPDLRNNFSRKEWKDCCGKGCKKCAIAQAYIAEHGRKDGLDQLKADQQVVLAKKRGDKKKSRKNKKTKSTK